MSYNEDPIFDTIHSLPVLGHSVAIATRTPTANYNQQSKFMPDYGGILETPNSNLKNNSLTDGFPFQAKSNFCRLSSDKIQLRLTSNECLAITSYLNSDRENEFSTIRAIEKDLFFDSIKSIKLSPGLHDSLLVKFEKKVNLLKLDRSYQIDSDPTQLRFDEQSVVESTTAVSERQGFHVKDAGLNPYNKTILGVASDNQQLYQVKLYDLTNGTRQPFQTIAWASDESDLLSSTESSSAIWRQFRGRMVRTFIPSGPASRGIQQLDHLPSHLFNMLVTTDYRCALIDPRQERLGQVYVDRSKISSVYPIEYLRRTDSSLKNDYQFYSLTNVHLRVFDTRYPGIPMNQVNHMLESDAYDHLNSEIIYYRDNGIETLCLSCINRLCFLTFDQSQESSLVNPKSAHLPYHEPNHDDSDKLYGLGVTTDEKRISSLFSVLQLFEDGDLSIRRYQPYDEDHDIDNCQPSRAETIVNEDRTVACINSRRQLPTSDDIEERDALTSDPIPDEIEFINIIEAKTDLVERMNSQRALDRFLKMREKLDTM